MTRSQSRCQDVVCAEDNDDTMQWKAGLGGAPNDANQANLTPSISGVNTEMLITGLIGNRGINQPGSMLISGRQCFLAAWARLGIVHTKKLHISRNRRLGRRCPGQQPKRTTSVSLCMGECPMPGRCG